MFVTITKSYVDMNQGIIIINALISDITAKKGRLQWINNIVLTATLEKLRQGPMSSTYMRFRKAVDNTRLGVLLHSTNSSYIVLSICQHHTYVRTIHSFL